MNRYARQMQLPDVGEAGQAKLAGAHIAVIGAGGLGTPVLQYLAGAGVGQISVFDPDVVEESNLHRQPIFGMSDLGRHKVEAARNAVQRLNPEVRVHCHATAIGPGIAPDIAETADLVIDAADSFAVSYILSDACFAAGTPLISASVVGQTGYVGAFCAGAPSLRAVFPELPMTSATCATAGVLGPVVGVIGSLQAQIALRILLEASPSALGRMVTADLAALTFGGFSFRNSPEPDRIIPFLGTGMLKGDDLIIELRDEIEAPEKITEYALRLSAPELPDHAFAADQRVVLCCRTGLRAWQAANALSSRGAFPLALLASQAAT